MKKFFLATILMVASACFAQQPIYNQAAGTFTWTISEVTTQQMMGCPGNNYNAEGQCMGTMQWYWHTGKVALSITNKRTGLTSSSAQTVTGGVATASVSLAVQPGDPIAYTETQQVYCPIAGVWNGISLAVGEWEIAQTRVIPLSANFPVSVAGNNAVWNTAPSCSNTGFNQPDFSPTMMADALVPLPTAWDITGLCVSLAGHQPWYCVELSQKKYSIVTPGRSPTCTYNP